MQTFINDSIEGSVSYTYIWRLNMITRLIKPFVCSHMETPSIKQHYKGGDINKEEPATLLSLISWVFVLGLKKNICNLHFKKSWSKTITLLLLYFPYSKQTRLRPWWSQASYGLVAQTIFEVSCSNFIRRILSRISRACWKLLMTDVSPHCHTPCIIWFGKQHTVFCSISMSQTVCKQLVITQFSKNHYFPMKCWTCSKLGFGMASAAHVMQCSHVSQVHMEERRRGEREQVKRFSMNPVSLCLSRAAYSDNGWMNSVVAIRVLAKMMKYYIPSQKLNSLWRLVFVFFQTAKLILIMVCITGKNIADITDFPKLLYF